jgi:ABC-2 type transport system ATP-binding protein
MIKVRDLQKQYNDVTVLDILDLTIAPGDSFGLVGNNGAGKTTLFSILLDLVEPTQGQAMSREHVIKGSDLWKFYTASYLDERFLIDFLTAEEYFQFVARLYTINSRDYELFLSRFADFFNGEILQQNKYIRDFSRGNQKKIGIAAAMMSNPAVLILDEPFPHLDPTSVMRLTALLREYHAQCKATLLISSHDLSYVTEVCNRVAILEKGRIVHDLKTDAQTLARLREYFSSQLSA